MLTTETFHNLPRQPLRFLFSRRNLWDRQNACKYLRKYCFTVSISEGGLNHLFGHNHEQLSYPYSSTYLKNNLFPLCRRRKWWGIWLDLSQGHFPNVHWWCNYCNGIGRTETTTLQKQLHTYGATLAEV